MTQHPPRRLLDDPSVDARLRRDLANARSHVARYDVQAGLEVLATALDGLGPTNAGRPTTGTLEASTEWTASLRAIGTKWWGWSAVGLSTVGAIWWLQREAPAHTAEARAASVVQSAQEETAAATHTGAQAPAHAEMPTLAHAASERPAQSPHTTFDAANAGVRPTPVRPVARNAQRSFKAVGADSARARPEHAGKISRTSATRASDPSKTRAETALQPSDVRTDDTALVRSVALPAPQDAAGSAQVPAKSPATSSEAQATHTQEIEHLARLRRLLAKNPEHALEAAREGQARFVGGLFAQERAALIVFALAKLERKRDTLHEARSFLRAYPSGPFVARVRAIAAELEGQGL